MLIRSETPEDIAAISEVTIAAFSDHPISQHTEQFIINALRRAKVLTISLVAEVDGKIIDAHYTLQQALRLWLWLHLPPAMLLVALVVVHVFTVTYY